MAAATRVAIVGAGWIAADHVAALTKRADVEIVAVCDLDRTRAAALAPPDASIHERWEDVLERDDVEALWVCVPPLAHREPTVAALERGIHVYLEKPIARTVDDAKAIVAAVDASDAVCAVGYQWHATEVLDDLRTELDDQEVALVVGRSLGPTGRRPWFLERAQGGGNVLERGSHQIDLARVIAGDVVGVHAAASPVLLGQAEGERGDIEDAATLELRHISTALTTIALAWTRQGLPGIYEVDIVASEATLRLRLDPAFSLEGISRGRAVSAKSREHPFERSIGRFLDAACARDAAGVFCTPADAAETLAVALACERSLASNELVVVTSSSSVD